jgi:hypothetical protein
VRALACAGLVTLAAAGCAASGTEQPAAAGATASPAVSAAEADARRDRRDSRPGSREMEEAN